MNMRTLLPLWKDDKTSETETCQSVRLTTLEESMFRPKAVRDLRFETGQWSSKSEHCSQSVRLTTLEESMFRPKAVRDLRFETWTVVKQE